MPAIIAMVSSSLYNMIDSIFIGHGVGPMAISGLALTMPLMNLAAAFGAMVGAGSAALTSIRLGQGNKPAAEMILGNVVLLNITMGIGFMFLGLYFLDDLLYLFGASENTIGYARDFMSVILMGNIVTHLYLGLNNQLRVSGYPRKSMYVMLVSVGVNVVLAALFIFVFGWGIKGSALATVIAQLVSLSIQIVHFTRPDSFLRFRRGIFRFKWDIIKNIIGIGMAPFFIQSCACVVVILINNALRNNGGDLYIGAYGIVNRVAFLFVMVVMGLNQGMQPIVGYNYGAEKYDRVIKVLGMTIGWAMAITTVGFIVSEVFPYAVVHLFVSEDGADRCRGAWPEDNNDAISRRGFPDSRWQLLPIHRQGEAGHISVADAADALHHTAAACPARILGSGRCVVYHAYGGLRVGAVGRCASLFPAAAVPPPDRRAALRPHVAPTRFLGGDTLLCADCVVIAGTRLY